MTFIDTKFLNFLLFDWLQADNLTKLARFRDHDREIFEAFLDLAEKLSARHFANHYKLSDQNEPVLSAGKVVLPGEIRKALDAYGEAGFFAAPFDVALGGMQLPNVVFTAIFAKFCAANIATAAYPMLTGANARLLAAHASPAQIEAWAIPQIEGRSFGTMCLSEPQAGSSLGDIRSKAVPDGDDPFGARYRISGNKMWISGGDHEMRDNIVHLVLAKVPDAEGNLPEGVRGISLFVVPRILPGGGRNDVKVAGLNHKMGYRGTVNCLLNFGESEGAMGWRIGEQGQGLAIMFHMMNEARIVVGLGAAALACRGLAHSLDYASERLQGRAIRTGEKLTGSAPVPIIRHPDVKRMLLAQKAYAQGALALVLFTARLVDDAKTHPQDPARKAAQDLLDLLTPVTKSWPSEWGLAANDLAIQVHGGYGYTRDFDVEQLYRDNRLNPIHEGTQGVQGLDLVGRRLFQGDGAGMIELGRRMRQTIARAQGQDGLCQFARQLAKSWAQTEETANALRQAPDAEAQLSNATLFLSAFGHVVVAWLWLDQTLTACDRTGTDTDFTQGILHTCRFFYQFELPKTELQFDLVAAYNDTATSMQPEFF